MKKKYIMAALFGCLLAILCCGTVTSVLYLPKLAKQVGLYSTMLDVIPIEYRILYHNEKLIAETIDVSKFPIVVEPRTSATIDNKTLFSVRTVDNEIYNIFYDSETKNIEVTYVYTDEPYWFKEDYPQILSSIRQQDESVKEFTYLLSTFDSHDSIESITVETDKGAHYSCIYDKENETVGINFISE